MTTPEPVPEVEVELRIKLSGPAAGVDRITSLVAALDELLADLYPSYSGVTLKVDAPLQGVMAPRSQALAEDIVRDLGIVPRHSAQPPP